MSQITDVIDELESAALEQTVTADEPRPGRLQSTKKVRGFQARRAWITVALVVAAAAVLGWWLYARQFETTDDAQIDGHINIISGRINGTVAYVNPKVENNQYVEAGTLLVELDPNDYQAALEHARADLATHEAAATSAGINVPITHVNAFSQLRLAEAARDEAIAAVDGDQAALVSARHKVQQDEAIFVRADRDRVRYEGLADSGVVSRQEIDSRQAEAWADGQTLEADRAAAVAAERRVAQARSLVVQRQAQVEASRTAPQQVNDAEAKSRSSAGQVELAKADVRTAELNLGYTKIYAPVSGIIGRKTVEVGHRIQQGQALLAIVPVDDIWVTAYFKETQLKMMRPGQPVSVHVDTFGRDYAGTIENLPGAAGTLFSLLPPENASGNYVKVVQRFPVRIRINRDQDPEHRLRPGMSVEPDVRVR
jgi:membrane fusion protein (multidrug efflux system)